ncbi:hypothetical protein LB467_16790 [Salegentibacter sp. JZCK2]|uniref:hypothetical protein n=1 Tax=Salegentibacter tibetensis TaxID=2873600 RepID=UPI001CCF580A|nr:hypothetical protein [Salegentibacter tibetensis]MBZ9731348.1 hypothetical protein [Salegentibacter tibetensis]
MSSRFTTYWNYGSTYCGLEYSSNTDGSTVIRGITALKRMGEFDITNTFEAKEFSEFAENISKYQHAFLCITSNQVLLKSIPNKGPVAKIVSSAFPNIDLDDFYFEILNTPVGSIIALCRKDHVNKIIATLELQGVKIIGFSLGFFSVQHLLRAIGEREFIASSYCISADDKSVLSYEKTEKMSDDTVYQISDTKVSSKFLLTLAGLFNYSGNSVHNISNTDSRNNELRKEHSQKVFFRKAMATAVSALLLLLLINFLLFSNYYNRFQELTFQYQTELSEKESYNQKLAEILQKEEVVKNILNNSNSRSTFYLNRLTADKPASVSFIEFIYQPFQKPVKENQPISLELGTIRIGGESTNENEFSNWTRDLEKIPWIAETKISGFGYSSTGNSDFVLILKLKPHETKD